MSSTTSSSQYGELKVENTNINTAPGVELSSTQKTLLGSVLDLFAGRPSLAKLQLWADDATFMDPITIAEGRKQYEPQWYGLQKAFSEIERKSHEVTSSGNPIEMDMTTRYVVKGINKEQIISSKILVTLDAAGEKIVRVEDRWGGEMDKDSSFKNVSSIFQLLSPFWWLRYGGNLAWWAWSLTWETSVWRVRPSPLSRLPRVFCGLWESLLTSSFRLFARSTPTLSRSPSACRRTQRRMPSWVTSRCVQRHRRSLTARQQQSFDATRIATAIALVSS
jgi:hypothetical protein